MVVLPELRLGLDPQLQPLGLRPSSAELRSEPRPVAVLAAGSRGGGSACRQGAQDPPARFIFAPQAAGHPGVIQNHLQCRKNPPPEKSISGQELAWGRCRSRGSSRRPRRPAPWALPPPPLRTGWLGTRPLG